MKTSLKLSIGLIALTVLTSMSVEAQTPLPVCKAQEQMTKEQVLKVCGKPTRVHPVTTEESKGFNVLNQYEWEYDNGERKVFVNFIDDVVNFIL
jgi:hypothetical protein